MYSSATSMIHDEVAAVSRAVLYAAPERNIASSKKLDTFPGSNVGKCTIGKCQWSVWKYVEMKVEMFETSKRAFRSIMPRLLCFSLVTLMDFDVSTSFVMISVN